MRDLWENGILQRIAIIAVIVSLLGISPLPHVVELGLRRTGRTLGFGSHLETAQHLALVAEHLPWRVSLWEPAGHYAWVGDSPELAIRYFKEAAAAGSLSLEGYLRFGDAYQFGGNLYTAVQIWEAANQIYGVSPESLTRIANAQREVKDYPALIATLKETLGLQPPGMVSPSSRSGLNFELGLLLSAYQPEAAPAYLLQSAEANPALTAANELAFTIQRALPKGNPSYTRMAAGQKLADLGEWELAALAFEGVTENQPDYVEAWAYLGEALQHVEQPDDGRAYTALEKAIQIEPQSLPANTFMALYWGRNGDPELAAEYLSAAAQLDPGNPDILVDLGAATAMLGDLEKAAAYYQAAVDQTSRNPVYLRALAAFCLRYNYNLKEIALPVAREALISTPHDPASLDLMGQLLLRLGDLLNAQRFFTRSIAQDPNYAPAHLHLGLVFSLQGYFSQAVAAYAQTISLAPGSPAATLAARLLRPSTSP